MNASNPNQEQGQQNKPEMGVSIADADRAGALMTAVFGDISQRAFHNFKGSPAETWRFVSLCTGPECKKADEVLNTPIDLVYFYAHAVTLDGQYGGEFIEATRCVLVDNKNIPVAFVSNGLARDLVRLIDAFGPGPYNPPIKVKIVQIGLKDGKRTFSIQPA